MFLVCLHIGAKLESTMLGVVDFHAGHDGTGAESGRHAIIRWEAVEPEIARVDHLNNHARWDLSEQERDCCRQIRHWRPHK